MLLPSGADICCQQLQTTTHLGRVVTLRRRRALLSLGRIVALALLAVGVTAVGRLATVVRHCQVRGRGQFDKQGRSGEIYYVDK